MKPVNTPVPPELAEAYRQTAYVVCHPPLVLQIGTRNRAAARLLETHGVGSALFISAHNPWGQALALEDNQQRHQALRHALQAWPVFEGFGAGTQGDWPPETSLLVLCDDPKQQIQWLRDFQQNAAVRVDAQGGVTLVYHPGLEPQV